MNLFSPCNPCCTTGPTPCTDPCAGNIDVTVLVCGSFADPSVSTVSVTGAKAPIFGGGSLPSPAIITPNGKFRFANLCTGLYNFTATGTHCSSQTRTNVVLGMITATCTSITQAITLSLNPILPYQCFADACCPSPPPEQHGPPYPPLSWPTSITVNDGIGAITLAMGHPYYFAENGGVGTADMFRTWNGCANRRAITSYPRYSHRADPPLVNSEVPVYFELSCGFSGGVSFWELYAYVTSGYRINNDVPLTPPIPAFTYDCVNPSQGPCPPPKDNCGGVLLLHATGTADHCPPAFSIPLMIANLFSPDLINNIYGGTVPSFTVST